MKTFIKKKVIVNIILLLLLKFIIKIYLFNRFKNNYNTSISLFDILIKLIDLLILK